VVSFMLQSLYPTPEGALVSIEFEAGWAIEFSLDVLEKRKICPSQKSNSNCPAHGALTALG
jgi:hypothetical protein